jgi:hypothetical protein
MFSQLGERVTLVGRVPVVVALFLWERGVNYSVEGAFLELGDFYFVGILFVLEGG